MSNSNPTYLDAFLNKGILDASGNALTARKNLRFLGATAVDNPALESTDVTIPAAGSDGQAGLSLSNGLNSNITLAQGVVQRITGPTAAFSIGGFAGTPGGGARLTLINTTSKPATIVHEDLSSTAANRINTLSSGSPITLAPQTGSVSFVYDAIGSRWVVQNLGIKRPLPFDIRDYGAVGDSTSASMATDNTTAINNAIAAAASAGAIVGLKGGEVVIPAGYFGFSGTLIIPDNVKIRGIGSRYVGPGAGGQFGSVLAYFGSGVAMAMTTVLTGADIRNVSLRDFILTGNQNGNTNATTGLHIAGNGGGPAVSDVMIERVTIAEFNVGVQWGDGDSSQADSISWYKCNTAYCNTYGWWINSANAGDSTWMHDCHVLGNLLNAGVAGCIGMYIQAAGNLVLDSCQGDSLGTWVKFTGGNVLTLSNCETETCDYFLDSNTSSGCPIVLDHNTINSGLRFAGNVRIEARGNMLTCIDSRGAMKGIDLNGTGVHWVGHENPNQMADVLTIFGTGTWDEHGSGTFSGLYDQAFHMQGENTWRPSPQYGASATTDVFSSFELCTRSGIRGAPWTASTVTAGGSYVVENPQGAEAFVCVAITSDDKTGAAQPTFNAGTTTVALGSDTAILPQATINVADTSAFPSSGTFGVRVFAGAGVWDWAYITYTSKDSTHFYGCTGGTGTGTMFLGNTVGVTTTDHNVVWADAGPSSLHELVAPAGHFNLDSLPGINCPKGTHAWLRSTVAAGSALGRVSIRDTVGGVAGDFRPFGTVWGDAVGSCPFPLAGSSVDGIPFGMSQHNVSVGTATSYMASASDFSKPFISITGSPGAPFTFILPAAGASLVSLYGLYNATTQPATISAGSGTTVAIPPQTRMMVLVGGNLVLPLLTTNGGALPSMVDDTAGTASQTLFHTGTSLIDANFASVALALNALNARLNALSI